MVDSNKLLKLKELLDNGAITQEEFDRQKSLVFAESSKQNKSEKFKIAIGIFVVVIICFAIIGSFIPSGEEASTTTPSQETVVTKQPEIPDEFKGDFPLSANGSIYDNIIGVPELSLGINNNTDKEISAIKIYFSPKDVYGEEVDSIFTTNQLYTDDIIPANGSVTKSWQLLDSEIKSGDIYIYSVYFSDGTEWGNKDAAVSDIKKYGHKFEVKY